MQTETHESSKASKQLPVAKKQSLEMFQMTARSSAEKQGTRLHLLHPKDMQLKQMTA